MSTTDYGLGYIRDGLRDAGREIGKGLSDIAKAISALDKTERIIYNVNIDATHDPEQIGEAIRQVGYGLRPK